MSEDGLAPITKQEATQRLRLMTKAQADGLATQWTTVETTMHGMSKSLANLVGEVAELGKQAAHQPPAPASGLLEKDLRAWRQVQEQLVALVTHARTRPLDWRTALGIFLLGLCLGSVGVFWWTVQAAPVVVQQVPAGRGK